jgi:plasmid stabilization system protein ParE
MDNAIAWYRERSVAASERFQSEVVHAIDVIGDASAQRRTGDDGNRRLIIRRSTFSASYFVSDGSVVVLALAHHRKQPHYWSQ